MAAWLSASGIADPCPDVEPLTPEFVTELYALAEWMAEEPPELAPRPEEE